MTDERSPLTKEDLPFLAFYKPNKKYAVQAIFTKTIDTIGFAMQTHSGKIKEYFTYGIAHFGLDNKTYTLHIYKQKKEILDSLEDYLFIPFTDNTNGKTTYGGGRYIDFKLKDIQKNSLQIDFNKCYNPYCMYKGGYSCPIPPSENSLDIAIKAGEKLYSKK